MSFGTICSTSKAEQNLLGSKDHSGAGLRQSLSKCKASQGTQPGQSEARMFSKWPALIRGAYLVTLSWKRRQFE